MHVHIKYFLFNLYIVLKLFPLALNVFTKFMQNYLPVKLITTTEHSSRVHALRDIVQLSAEGVRVYQRYLLPGGGHGSDHHVGHTTQVWIRCEKQIIITNLLSKNSSNYKCMCFVAVSM